MRTGSRSILITIFAIMCSCESKENSLVTLQARPSPTSASQSETQIGKSESDSVSHEPETNCSATPILNNIALTESWTWKDDPNRNYKSPPVVGDLDKDGQPEIVLISNENEVKNPRYADGASLVVIDGKSGTLKWRSNASLLKPLARSTPVLVDLNDDSKPEIITAESDGSNTNLVAIDYNRKTLLWRTAVVGCFGWCVPSTADVNGDGLPEIILGRSIVTASGEILKNIGSSSTDQLSSMPFSTMVDLIPENPGLEFLHHSFISDSKNDTLFNFSGYTDTKTDQIANLAAFMAAADLDRDKKPELIIVRSGVLAVYSNSGKKNWSVSLDTSAKFSFTPENNVDVHVNNGGAPSIGDLNGDGFLEIAVASSNTLAVFSHDGKQLWQYKSKSGSSSAGSSIHDLNGDGKGELIFNDSTHLRIFDGVSGNVLAEAENEAGRGHDYPVVVNIDNNSSPAIIVTSKDKGGVRAFRDAQNKWQPSRKLWNQFNYFPELIADSFAVVKSPGIPVPGFRASSLSNSNKSCKN